MDKAHVIQEAKAFFTTKIAELREVVDNTRQMAADAPGRIASRYDTSREETSWLADGQTALLNEWRRSLMALERLPMVDCATIQSGSLCVLQRQGESLRLVFLVCPGGAGYEVQVDGQAVLLLSPACPLVRSLVGMAPGSTVAATDGKSYRIEEVQ